MGTLTDVARRIVGQVKAAHASEKRVGWIENELRNVRLGFDFLDDKIRKATDQDNQNILSNKPEDGAGDDATRTKFVISDNNCIGGNGTYFDRLGLAAGHGIGLHVTNQGFPITDANGVESPMEGYMMYGDNGEALTRIEATVRFLAEGGDLGDWIPTFSGVDVKITHLPVASGGAGNKIGGEPCAPNVCPAMIPELIVREPDETGSATDGVMTFAGGPLNVDCVGHVHEMYEHMLYLANTVYTDESSSATHYVKDVSLAWDVTGTDEKTFDLKLNVLRRTVAAPPPSGLSGQYQVVRNVSMGYDWKLVVTMGCLTFTNGVLTAADFAAGCAGPSTPANPNYETKTFVTDADCDVSTGEIIIVTSTVYGLKFT